MTREGILMNWETLVENSLTDYCAGTNIVDVMYPIVVALEIISDRGYDDLSDELLKDARIHFEFLTKKEG